MTTEKIRFEIGKVYAEHRRYILEEYIVRYKVVRRTEKTVWVCRINDDGTEGLPEGHRVEPFGDCEYIHGRGIGNPRSVWYSDGLNLFSKDEMKGGEE